MSVLQFKDSIKQPTYRPRSPAAGLLYQTIEDHFEGFLFDARANEKVIPDYVLNEFDAYLKCGILEHGFIQLKCDQCNSSQLVAFSCKKRGFCPSCIGKRMNEGSLFGL